MSRPLFGPLLIVVASLAAAGCSSAIRYPKLRGPGPAGYQRANAEAFDPYPLPDLGPPIDGGRPREFGIPRNEVERAQDYSIVQAARRGQRPGPPTTAIAAPPMVASPPPAFTAPSSAPAFVPTTPTTPAAPVYTQPAPVVTPTMPVMPSAPYGQPSIRY
ncbi:MAG: hypothetical protein C0485_18130 [Pirellula sp.]|nr:hypothetical protein [Pirellula sp.]